MMESIASLVQKKIDEALGLSRYRVDGARGSTVGNVQPGKNVEILRCRYGKHADYHYCRSVGLAVYSQL